MFLWSHILSSLAMPFLNNGSYSVYKYAGVRYDEMERRVYVLGLEKGTLIGVQEVYEGLGSVECFGLLGY